MGAVFNHIHSVVIQWSHQQSQIPMTVAKQSTDKPRRRKVISKYKADPAPRSVVALAVCDVHLYYECHRCKKVHRHGSSGDLLNRTTMRHSHCDIGASATVIIIDDTTRRCSMSRRPRASLHYGNVFELRSQARLKSLFLAQVERAD